MRIALTGASGTVGEFVLRALLARGHSVVALSRNRRAELKDEQALSWLVGDISDTAVQQALLTDTDALIHTAFTHVPGRYRGGEGNDPQAFWRANFLSTLSLLTLAETAATSRVVLISSRAVFDAIGNHDVDPDSRIDDSARPAPNTHYGALKAATEHLAQTFVEQYNLSVTTLRPTGIYGVRSAHTQSKWYSLSKRALSGFTSNDALPDERLATEVHGDDVASAIMLLLEADDTQVAGRVFNCSDIALSRRELVAAFNDIAAGRSIEHRFHRLHPEIWPPRSLRCDALSRLGWKPGGRDALIASLCELISIARNDLD